MANPFHGSIVQRVQNPSYSNFWRITVVLEASGSPFERRCLVGENPSDRTAELILPFSSSSRSEGTTFPWFIFTFAPATQLLAVSTPVIDVRFRGDLLYSRSVMS